MPTKKFVATEELRRQVKKLAGFRLTAQEICTVLDIPATAVLKRHFAKELTQGPIEADAKVAATAFRLALSERNVAMMIFLLKTHARWLETGVVEQEERPQGPVQWVVTVHQPPRTAKEQAEIEKLKTTDWLGKPEQPEWEGDRGDENEDW